MEVIRVGTRRSALARAQTSTVLSHFKKCHSEYTFSEEVILSSGDRKQGTAAASCGDKRDWIDVFEDSLQSADLDLAVHCGKDVPVDIAEGLAIRSVLSRDTAQDVFIGRLQSSGKRLKFEELSAGSVIGTASCRRRAQLLNYNQELRVVELRGNVNTRIASLDAEDSIYAGIILAEAGIKRLGLNLQYQALPIDHFIPAVNQGILAVEFTEKQKSMQALVEQISVPEVEVCFCAERLVIKILQADCKSAVGVYAQILDGAFEIKAQVLSLDGTKVLEACFAGNITESLKLAEQLAEQLISQGAVSLLRGE